MQHKEVNVLDHHLRAYKDELLRPVAGCMGNISPNTITVVAAAGGLAAARAAAQPRNWAAQGFWGVSRGVDGVDGMVARGVQPPERLWWAHGYLSNGQRPVPETRTQPERRLHRA